MFQPRLTECEGVRADRSKPFRWSTRVPWLELKATRYGSSFGPAGLRLCLAAVLLTGTPGNFQGTFGGALSTGALAGIVSSSGPPRSGGYPTRFSLQLPISLGNRTRHAHRPPFSNAELAEESPDDERPFIGTTLPIDYETSTGAWTYRMGKSGKGVSLSNGFSDGSSDVRARAAGSQVESRVSLQSRQGLAD
jgi:hypothetical protein